MIGGLTTWEITWTGGLPHLPGVLHQHVNMFLESVKFKLECLQTMTSFGTRQRNQGLVVQSWVKIPKVNANPESKYESLKVKVILLVLAFFIRYFFRTINLNQLGLFCLPSNWNIIFLEFWDELWGWSRSIVLPCTAYGPDQASAKSTVPKIHKILSCPV